MSAVFFQNGVSIGATAGWCGYTGSNNYVVRYQFSTGAQGADSVSIALSGIYYGNGAGSQSFGFKISSSSVAYANARNTPPDSNYGVMRYSSDAGYGCIMSASGLNLAPNSVYYLFVYLATAGTEYYSGWNCVSPSIVCSGTYTPPAGSISSITAQVSTQSAVAIILSGSPCAWHKATFSYQGKTLGISESFVTALSHICPRDWLSHDTHSQSIEIDVSVQGYLDADCQLPYGEALRAAFILKADSGMRPVLSPETVSAIAVNDGTASAFEELIAGISRVQINFDKAKINLQNCAGAEIAAYALSYKDTRIEDSQPLIQTGILSADTVINCVVIDTRGREGSVSISLSMLPYVPPSLSSVEAVRCNEDGKENELGEYFRIRAESTFTSLEGKNNVTLSVNYQPTGGNWGDERKLSGFESGIWSHQWREKTLLGGSMQGDSYKVSLTITDAVGCASRYTLGLYHQSWAMKFNRKGTAVGFGMEPTVGNAVQLPDSWRLYAGAIVLSEGSYGYEEPENVVTDPVPGQLYFLISD